MPIEVALWRLGENLTRVQFTGIEAESKLEDLLADDIGIVDAKLLLIGRQVPASYGTFVDLLAMDSDGNLVVMELKRNRTPREVIAQLLDYGSWIRNLEDDDIATIYGTFLAKYHPERAGVSLDQSFIERFHVEELPETLNTSHELMVIASELDDSTERIITYLADEYGVAINAVFFRYFRDGDRDYLSRAWLIDPGAVEAKIEEKRLKLPWNGEFYVSFGHHDDGNGRHWEDARKYGFVSAGGGDWYVKTLRMLEPDSRIWVNVPGHGYAGVGRVLDGPVPATQFNVNDANGKEVPITQMPLSGRIDHSGENPNDMEEWFVRVQWLKTVPLQKAIREKGFFGNQNSAAKPRTKKWVHTVDRLKVLFGITD